jgi:Phage capsid family
MSDILEKAVTTSAMDPGTPPQGGLLNAEQSNRFIDYMWDATALAKEGRVVRMKADTTELDFVNVGAKIVRLATEATDTGVNADPTFSKISLTTKKLRLDWEVSTESLEDNIEGGDLEDHVARLMATQAGNDIEDLAINGNTSLTGDALYKAFDGFRKQALSKGHVVAGGSAAISRVIFNDALKALPRKYKQNRSQLRFYTGSNVVQNYLYGLSDLSTAPETIVEQVYRGTVNGPQGSGGGTYPLAFGIPIVEVPLFREDLDSSGVSISGSATQGTVELTFPQNRIWGIKREITTHREFKPKKDTWEFTVYTRVGIQVENWDAYVIVRDVDAA